MPENDTEFSKSIYSLTEADNRFFFTGNDGTGSAAWMFNGTIATQLFDPSKEAKQQRAVANLTTVGNNAYFYSSQWDDDFDYGAGGFPDNVHLYFSDGTASGTYRLWSSKVGVGYSIQNAAKTPVGAAGNRLVFLAPQNAVYSNAFMGVAASDASFEPLMIGAEPVRKKTNHPELVSTHNGAWIDAEHNIIFTDGTTNGTFALPRNGILYVNSLNVVNDRPWFTARTTHGGKMSIWRGLPLSEWAPSRPMLLEPTHKNRAVSATPTFLWNKSVNTESYQLQVSEQDDFSDLVFDNAAITDTTFTLNDTLAYTTNYFWRVRASNNDSTGDWSSTFELRTVYEKPDAPKLSSPLNEAVDMEVDRKFYWANSARASSYTLQISELIDFSTTFIDTTVNSNRLLDHPHFDVNNTYYWRVKASNNGGESDWSTIWSFSTSIAVSTESKNTPVKFTLQQNYPNPFNPTTQIQYGIQETVNVRLTIFNMLGQEIATLVNEKKSAGWHTVNFDASGFSSGFYIYRIQAGDFVDTKKLMLIK